MQRYHLTIVIVISISALSASPRPANRCDPPISRGDKEVDGGKKNTSTDAFGSSVWNLSVYLATQCQRRAACPAGWAGSGSGSGCGWCYFWREGRAAVQGVAVKGWSGSGWLTDWLCQAMLPFPILRFVLLQPQLFSSFRSTFSLRLQPLRCIPRPNSICSFLGFRFAFGLGLVCTSFGVSRSWDCTSTTTTTTRAGKTSK